MKIGILTYHRSHNYGALLQALALRKVLSDIGHEVSFFDYYPEYHQRMYTLFDKKTFQLLGRKAKLLFLKNHINTYFYRKRRFDVFRSFIKKYIEPNCISVTEKVDCAIYGSDQIWRKQNYIFAYNSIYFGDDQIIAKKKISYAASLVDLPNSEDANRFLSLVRQLDRVSVREKPVADYLSMNGIEGVVVSLDPTLLLEKESWDALIKPRRIIAEDYILVYDLQDDFGVPTFNYESIRRFARTNNLRIVRLRAVSSSFGTKFDRHNDGPSDFINLIRYASYVITSSFHGVIFSLVFEKQLFTSFPRNSQRARSLLHFLDLEERLLEPLSDIPSGINDIDYKEVNEKFRRMREESLEYLRSI